MDGYAFALRLGGTVVTGRTSASMDLTWDMIDATTDDSSQNKEYEAGEGDGTISVEGKLGASDTYSFSELKTAGDARTPVAALFGKLSDGSRRFSCNVLVSNLNLSAPKNDSVVWTATLQKTGALTEGTYTTTA